VRRYYFAVAEFSSAATADAVYEACDGLEFELSSNKLDLRFVPEDQSFEGRATRDKCTDVSPTVQYSAQCTVYSAQCTVYSAQCTGTVYSAQCTVYSAQCTVHSAQCEVHSVQCTVYSAQCTVYIVQCTVYSAQCTVHSVQCTVHSVQCTVYSAQCTVYSVQCTVHSVQCTVHSVQCTVYIVQCTVHSVQCTVHSAQCTVYSVQCTMHSAQCTVHSVQCTVHSVQCTVHSARGLQRPPSLSFSSNKLDLRYVPKDQTFEGRAVHDKCTEVNSPGAFPLACRGCAEELITRFCPWSCPWSCLWCASGPGGYEAPVFTTRVLQHSRVKLTWDGQTSPRASGPCAGASGLRR